MGLEKNGLDLHPGLNLWGFKRGPKGFVIKYLDLYHHDAEAFKRYFEESNDERKMVILKGIIPISDADAGLREYLEKNYAEMIKNVGRDSLIK